MIVQQHFFLWTEDNLESRQESLSSMEFYRLQHANSTWPFLDELLQFVVENICQSPKLAAVKFYSLSIYLFCSLAVSTLPVHIIFYYALQFNAYDIPIVITIMISIMIMAERPFNLV